MWPFSPREIEVIERPPAKLMQVYIDQAYNQLVRWNKVAESYARKNADQSKIDRAERNVQFYGALVQLLSDMKEEDI